MACPSLENFSKCQSISDAFLELYKEDGFVTLSPCSLVHDSVSTSFVMSAGLIQIENELDAVVKETGGKFAFTQPCFRHFDVIEVGKDTTHLSLFHMSAAFSVGSTDRETVLPRLWHFLIKILKLNKHKLWITYLDDSEFGKDQRTYDCWIKNGVNESNLIGLSQEYCFWKQRSAGKIASDGKKCGPHSEVFVERDGYPCSKDCTLGNPGTCSCGRFVEVSNSLFIENYISIDNQLIQADSMFAECVIGIERLAMITQGVRDVHQVDLFEPYRKKVCALLAENLTALQNSSINIIIDHIHAFVLLVEEGAPMPSRKDRGRMMQKLARGIMTDSLIIDLELEKIISIIESKKSKLYLLTEWIKYDKTIINGEKMIRKKIKNNNLSENFIDNLYKNYGIPKKLLSFLLNNRYPEYSNKLFTLNSQAGLTNEQ